MSVLFLRLTRTLRVDKANALNSRRQILAKVLAERLLLRASPLALATWAMSPRVPGHLIGDVVEVGEGVRELHVERRNVGATLGHGGHDHDKVDFAKRVCALLLFNPKELDPAEELSKLLCAGVTVFTAWNPKAVAALVQGLGGLGKLPSCSPVTPTEIAMKSLVSSGDDKADFASAHAINTKKSPSFTKLGGVPSLSKQHPLDNPKDAVETRQAGWSRCRSYLVLHLNGPRD
ncbi:hypothetical protein CEK25_004981 [Fusarium fujikuroi]|nr:hypothetical protein CEK25_004981 [Fusarium fujikuroi]